MCAEPGLAMEDEFHFQNTGLTYHELISDTAERHGLDPDLIRAIIQVESGYDPRAVSEKGAKGLMQLMPATARSLGVTRVFDPKENVAAGVRYLKRLQRTFHGSTILALAAYHAGEGSVTKHKGVPPFKETQDYIYKVLLYWSRHKSSSSQP